MKNDIIVAVELASSAIRGIAGRRLPNGTVEVVCVAEEPSQSCIHKGVVDNIEKTTQAISTVIERLNFAVGGEIKRVYVGLSGQSLHTRKNTMQKQFEETTQITSDMMDAMRDANCSMDYPGLSIHEVVQQESHVGNRHVEDPVGIMSDSLEVTFLNVLARTTLKENIERCVNAAGVSVAEILVSPLVLADSILRPDEKRSGCAIVDMGAETTTVVVYSKNLLRHLIVLPIGGANVTQDIMSKRIEWEEAESLKLRHSTAYRNNSSTKEGTIQLKYGQSIAEEELLNLIEARYHEIVKNAWHQIKPYSNSLLSGQIILTGGVSHTNNIAQCFQLVAKCEKQIKEFKGLPEGVIVNKEVMLPEDGRYLSLLSILLHGDQNCLAPKAPEPVPEPKKEPEKPVEVTPAPVEEPKKEEKPKKKSGLKSLWDKIVEGLSEADE